MAATERNSVVDKRGNVGVLTTRIVDPDHVAVEVDSTTYLIPRNALISDGDGAYHVNFAFEGLETIPRHPAHMILSDVPPATPTLEAPVEPDDSASPRHDLPTVSLTDSQTVEVEDVSIERIPVNRLVDGPVGVRQEGDVTIIPVVEEVLVVQKRMRIKEEIRVTKTRRSLSSDEAPRVNADELYRSSTSPNGVHLA